MIDGPHTRPFVTVRFTGLTGVALFLAALLGVVGVLIAHIGAMVARGSLKTPWFQQKAGAAALEWLPGWPSWAVTLFGVSAALTLGGIAAAWIMSKLAR